MKYFFNLLAFLLIPLVVFGAVNDDYLVGLGKAYLKKGLITEAEEEFKRALVVNPTNQEAQKHLDNLANNKKSFLSLHAITVLTGYLDEEMRYEKDHRGIPLLFSFGFDAKPLFSKIGIKTKGRLDLIVEPFINTILEPRTNIEVGSNFLFEYAFPLSKRFQPYLKGGIGVMYMSQHIKEQSTQYNFLPQGSVGFNFYLTDNIAVSCEYRHRHFSNADLKKPNKGVDAKLYLAGISFFFD